MSLNIGKIEFVVLVMLQKKLFEIEPRPERVFVVTCGHKQQPVSHKTQKWQRKARGTDELTQKYAKVAAGTMSPKSTAVVPILLAV